MAQRISNDVERGQQVRLTVDGAEVTAFAGETLATVLLAEGITTFNRTRTGQPRGPFCNMGTCFECQVKVTTAGASGDRWVRACLHTVEEGMAVITGAHLQQPGPAPHD